jgi:hypothetical protein
VAQNLAKKAEEDGAAEGAGSDGADSPPPVMTGT